MQWKEVKYLLIESHYAID